MKRIKAKELLKLCVKLDSGIEDDYIPLFYRNTKGDIICQWNDEGDLYIDTDIYIRGQLNEELESIDEDYI